MNLTELSHYIRRNIVATITVLIIFSAFGVFLVKQYMDLYDKQTQLDQKVKDFYDSSLLKEQELLKREKELYKQEISLQNEKYIYQKKSLELSELKNKYEKINSELEEKTKNSSETMRRQLAENRLSTLMSEFSAMGISLRQPPDCNDKEGWKQFNAARAKLSEAMSFARANGLYEDYQSFFNANSSFMLKGC